MEAKLKSAASRKMLTGNAAAAYAAMLCRPDIIAAYPITPSTEILEVLYRFQADGLLKSTLVEPEGEHSVMSILITATCAGARTFTATSSQGLFYMYEPYIYAAAHRIPIVMVNATRETTPAGVAGGGQDIVMVKDAGWIHIHTETCQEILDTVITSYRLAEDPDILLPVTIAYDGYFLSHRTEAVNIPGQEAVDAFLPRRKRPTLLDPQFPMTNQSGATIRQFNEYRLKHLNAMQRAKTAIDDIEKEYQHVFGSGPYGQIEEYRCEDADIVLVTLGSCTGTARVAVDRKRNEGVKVGLVKVRMFRPFPHEKVAAALNGKGAIGVVDRNVCFGWNSGHLMVEVRASLAGKAPQGIPLLNFIGGLNGGDITLKHISRAIDALHLAGQGKPCKELTFFDLE